MTRLVSTLALASAALLFPTAPARALVTNAQQCQALVTVASAKYAQCRLTAESKFAKSLDAGRLASSLSKCHDKFDSSFSKALLRYPADCPMVQGAAAFESVLTVCSNDVVAAAGGGSAPVCGDGIINVAGEQCDGADLGGETCSTLGFSGSGLSCDGSCKLVTSGCTILQQPATGQTTCWNDAGAVIPCAGTGHDGNLQAGATLAYQDNGDGTITDLNTGLMWEKQSRDGSIHDRDNTYTWSAAFSSKIAGLNAAGGFAGHTDWRLPNRKELETILNLENAGPAVSPVFDSGCVAACTVLTCSCISASDHWSSTTYADIPIAAWVVSFDAGHVFPDLKTTPYYARAVRGGS